jgi:hypothetical protein
MPLVAMRGWEDGDVSRGTLALSWGTYGGFYICRWRICLGWVALTFLPGWEIDTMMRATAEAGSPASKDGQQ